MTTTHCFVGYKYIADLTQNLPVFELLANRWGHFLPIASTWFIAPIELFEFAIFVFPFLISLTTLSLK